MSMLKAEIKTKIKAISLCRGVR